MKIWIDFINSPQVSFALPFISRLTKEGHEFILTCRDSGNTVALLEQNRLAYTVIGKKAVKGNMRKLLSFPLRVFRLYRHLSKMRPDVSFGQSSFYLPAVSFLMRIKSIYTNDNEHAKGNIAGFLFARRILLPSLLSGKAFFGMSLLQRKIEFYPGVKEGLYLSQMALKYHARKANEGIIFFRPEPWTAQYYDGPRDFFDDVLAQLSSKYDTIVLPRDTRQYNHYKARERDKLRVAEHPLELREIAENCLLFIGAGGSMTREVAVLGLPTLSVYHGASLEVDRFLADRRMMYLNPRVSVQEIEEIISNSSGVRDNSQLLEEGRKAFDLFLKVILDGNSQN